MYHLTPCKVVDAEFFMRLPDHLRRDNITESYSATILQARVDVPGRRMFSYL